MKIHELKSWPESFHSIKNGRKRAELREDDRAFKEGDFLHLMEYEPTMREPTGEDVVVRIIHIQRCSYEPLEKLPEGWVLLSIRLLE